MFFLTFDKDYYVVKIISDAYMLSSFSVLIDELQCFFHI